MPDNITIFGQIEGEDLETDKRAPVRVSESGELLVKVDPTSESQVVVAANNPSGDPVPLQVNNDGRLKVEAGFAGTITVDNIEFGTALAPADNMTGIQGPVVVAALMSQHDGTHWDTVKSDKQHGIYVKVNNDLTIDNFPDDQQIHGTVSISGSVLVTDGAGSLTVDGTVGATQVGEWNIGSLDAILNTVSIDDNDASITVDGTVSIGNLPEIQTVDGTVTVQSITNAVAVTDNGGSLTVDGSVAVSNFPATQVVSGTITVGNASINVNDGGGSITVDGTVGVSGVVPISDNNASITVDGSVSISNFPAIQPVSDNGGSLTVDGTVAISNSSIAVTDNGGSLTVDGTVQLSNIVADGDAATVSDRIMPIGGIDGSGNWQALKVDSSGKIEVAGTLTVSDGSGPITVDGSLSIDNFPATQTVAGTVTIGNASLPVTDNGGSLTVDGSVSVSNFPATQPVSGTVTVGNASIPVTDNGGSLTVDGTVAITGTVAVTDNAGSLTVDGTVDIGNFPAVQPVSDNGGSLTVDGTVAISNPTIAVTDNGGSLTIDGTVNAVQSGTWTVGVSFPASIDVADGGGSLTVDGTVAIGNFPATQAVSGTVNIGNTPIPITDNNSSITIDGTVAVSAVSGTVAVTDNGSTLSIDDGAGSITVDGTVSALQSGTWDIGSLTTVVNAVKIDDNGGSITVDGSISVSNFPATQPVSGTVTVGNASIPVTDNGGSLTVDGSVSISNLPAVQPVSDNNSSLTVDGTVTVQDGGGSLTVDGSVAVTGVSGNVTVIDGGGSLTVDGTVSLSNVVADGATSVAGDRIMPVGGIDGAGAWQALKVDTAGRIELSGTITVGDGSGPLTVDGTVAATQSGTWSVRAQDGSGNNLTSALRGSERALSAQVVDASGNQVTAFRSTQYTEDAASAGAESLTLAGAIRQDTPASSTSADGDYANLKTDSVGRLWVNNSGVTQPVSQSGTWNIAAVTSITNAVAVTDNNGTLSIDDGAGSITIDGSVGQSGTWSVRAQDGSGNNLTSAARGTERALSVQLIDGSGNQITSFTNTQYAEDAASAGGESMTLAGTIRQDTPVSTTSLDGDYANLKTDSVGRLWVNNSGVTQPVSGTVAATQSGTWNVGTLTSITNAVAVTDNGTTLSIDDGAGSITIDGSVSQTGTWSVRAQDGSGNALTSALRGSERAISAQIVDASGNQVTAFRSTQYTEDAASAGGETLTLVGAVRQDTPASSVSADGDYINLKTDSLGRLWVNASGAAIDMSNAPFNKVRRIETTFTRPADTTAYTAGDAVSNSTTAPTILSFANAASGNTNGGVITAIMLSKSTATTANARFRLYLYAESVTAVNDNSAFSQTYANTQYLIGIQDFSLASTGANTAFATESGLYIPYQMATQTSIFAHLVALEAYAPGSAEAFRIVLHVTRDI